MADRIAGDQRFILSRRTALAGFAATCAASLAGPIAASQAAENSPGPLFSPSGPNAEFYGAAESYPVRDPALGFVPGNPLKPKYRVGAFSHYAELFPTRLVEHAATPWQFKRARNDRSVSRARDRLSVAPSRHRAPDCQRRSNPVRALS